MRRIVIVLLAFALAATIAGLWLRRPVSVPVMTITRGDVADEVSATATVEARSVALAAKIAGRVASVMVREGERVASGQMLVVLDSGELVAQVDQSRAVVRAAQAQQAQAVAALAAEAAEVEGRVRQAGSQLVAVRAQRAKIRAGAQDADVAAAEAEVARAQASADDVARDRQRIESLYTDGAVPRASLDAVTSAERVAQAQLVAARERLAAVRAGARLEDRVAADAAVEQAAAALQAARDGRRLLDARQAGIRAASAQVAQAQAALRAAAALLGGTRIVAPFAGTVVRAMVEPGQVIAPGMPLLELADLTERWVTVDAGSDDLARFEAVQTLEIRSESYPDRVFAGRIRSIASIATAGARGKEWTVRVKISIQDPELLLRPGMEVDVDGRVTLARHVLHMPKEGALEQDGRRYVFVWDGTTFRRTAIIAGPASQSHIAVRLGLRDGDMVAVSGLEHLRQGHRVRVVQASR